MKFALLVSTSFTAALALACSSGESSPDGSGGSPSSPGTGGAVAQMGGAPATGGASNGTGGAAMSGGASSGGSQATSGGLSGSGGSSGGLASGGAPSGGASNASGGAAMGGAASGGTTSSGGNGSAGSPSGGAGGNAGSAGAAAQGGAANDTTLAGTFDGALITYPCGSNHSNFDCDNVGCSNGQVSHTQTFKMGGDSGTIYDVTFRVRGVVETYNYVGGTRDAGNDSITKNPDLFLRGGAPQPSGASGYDYDVYELNVSPPVAGAPATYYLNSVTASENPHTSGTTLHLSFKIDYTKTIKAAGGATITVKQYDSNCKSVMNCGTNANSCSSHHTINLDGASPAPPSTFTQPYQMPNGAYGQWLFFDVTSVKVAQ